MSPASQLHAVVVDDEPSYLYLLETILSELLTCSIKAYTQPELALAELPKLDVGIIVTDFYMPKIDGVEFLKRVHVIKPDVPCLMITGHKELLDRMDTSDLTQLRSVMAKPFKIDVLAKEISRHWPEAMV